MKKYLSAVLFLTLFLSIICYPMKKIEMKPYFSEKDDDENYQFYMAIDYAVDDDLNVYIIDLKECIVKKYDKNGAFVLSFGKKGNGPGEINFPRGIVFSAGKIYIPQFMRMDVFSTDGVFEKSLSYPLKIQVEAFKIIEGKTGVIYGIAEDKIELIAYSINDPDKRIKKITSTDFSADESGIVSIKNDILFGVTKNDEIIFGLNNEIKVVKYSIRDNSRKTIINYNYSHKKYPEESIKAIMESRKKSGRTNLPPLPEYYPMLFQLSVDDNDNIWINIVSNEKSGLMRFDKNGKFIDDYELRLQGGIVFGGKIIIKKNFIFSFGMRRDEGVKIERGTLN